MQWRMEEWRQTDLPDLCRIWNRVVEDGMAFPQTEPLTPETGRAFFAQQSFTAVVRDQTGRARGLYILHPNNIGRCGHIANPSYAVDADARGLGCGEALVAHCLTTARQLGFRILQFNAVVATNTPALALYKKMGFIQLGVIPGGFHAKDGRWMDIIPHYKELTEGTDEG